MEVVEQAAITLEGGVQGDFRGALKGKPYKRQVTLIEARDWDAAMAAVQRNLPWSDRRANLLVDGIDLPQQAGARLRVGAALLEITVECDPCKRMDALVDGLQLALTPDWRGGACAKVIEPGPIAVGDTIRIEG